MARSFVLGALFLLGCSVDAERQPDPVRSYASLVGAGDWRVVEPDADPFVTDPGAVPRCSTSGVRVESDPEWLEIDTTVCSWVSLTGGARFEVALGEQLKLELSHFDLDAPAPATAELRLRLGDCDAWSGTIPIPSPADVRSYELASPCALPAGDAVWFHLHNHGQNSYQLQDVAVLR